MGRCGEGNLGRSGETGEGRLAVLTSRRPGTEEDDRRVVGCYVIDKIGFRPSPDGFNQHEVWSTNPRTRWRVSGDAIAEGAAPRFHDLLHTPCRFGQGPFIYIDDDDAQRVLEAVRGCLSPLERTVAEDLEARADEETYVEGKATQVLCSKYERNTRLVAEAIRIHGCRCAVCGFDFEAAYGPLGKDYIEAHHLVPLHEYEGTGREVSARDDMTTVCANCHRMLHRRRKLRMTPEKLKKIVAKQKASK